MLDSILTSRAPVSRIWAFSDLQQGELDLAERYLDCALADMHDLQLSPTAIWYLGDAVQGHDIDRVTAMTQMQVKKLGALGIPLCFVMGNHDLDCAGSGTTPVLPGWEAFRKVPGWRTTAQCNDFYFTETYGTVLVVFLSDHIAPDNRWLVRHQKVHGPKPETYEITVEAYHKLRETMVSWKGPVIIAGHYAFPGGARDEPKDGLLCRLLPLPENVKLVLHGHAHIGDWVWAKQHTFQRLGWVHWHNIPQVNVSSLDGLRGSQPRSIVLDLYADGTFGLFFRDHYDRVWSDMYFCDMTAPRSRTKESTQLHSNRNSIAGTPLEAWKKSAGA